MIDFQAMFSSPVLAFEAGLLLGIGLGGLIASIIFFIQSQKG